MVGADDDRRYIVQSVDKALKLVEIIADSPPEGISLTAATRALGMSKSAVFALLRTLESHGYVRESASGHRYRLGISLLWLGNAVDRQSPLASIARSVIQNLTEVTGMTSRLAVAEDGFAVFVDRVDGPGMVRFQTVLGQREEPHVSAAGKAILAHLSDDEVKRIVDKTGLPAHTDKTITSLKGLLEDLELVRRRGYALDDGEDVDSVFCVGAAFVDRSGACAGAVSVTGLKGEASSANVETIAQSVREHADEVTRLLAGR